MDDNWLWHHRFGHLSLKSLSFLSKNNIVNGLPFNKSVDNICESCIRGKHHRDPFPKKCARRASKPIGLLHVDLCGPIQTLSLTATNIFLCLWMILVG